VCRFVLSRDEAKRVLFALDAAIEVVAADTPLSLELADAARLIVEKFLPDLPNL